MLKKCRHRQADEGVGPLFRCPVGGFGFILTLIKKPEHVSKTCRDTPARLRDPKLVEKGGT